jgi:predicted dinucleotide-binding enzyme
MRIGIIGSGNIGGTAARLFVDAGNEVALSHAGGPESLRQKVAKLGPKACSTTIEEAADFGDVVLLAIPWRNREDLPAERLAGKIVIDATNPYAPDLSLYDLGDSTSSEEVKKVLPGARVVKAFNTLVARDLGGRGRKDLALEERTALLVGGDDQDAKRVVARLVQDIGYAPVDTGSLHEGGRMQQPGSPLYGRVMTGIDAHRAVHQIQEQQGRPAAPSGGGAAQPPA